MKKLLALLTLFVIVLATSVYAKNVPIWKVYMVDAEFTTTRTDTFNWTDTPWLYFQVPKDPKGKDVHSTSLWSDDLSNIYQTNKTEAVLEIWHSIANWDSIREAGLWTVDVNYGIWNNRGQIKDSGSGSTSFTVVGYAPEPISSTLFIVGGATLGFRCFWKKRRMN